MPIRYDESKWPWVVVTMPAEPLTDDAFAEHLQRISSYFTRGARFGLVMDARKVAAPLNQERRRQVAELIDREVAAHGEHLIGTAVVLSSAVGRGVFKVIQWTTRSNHPMMSFDSVEPALAWLRGLGHSSSKMKAAPPTR